MRFSYEETYKNNIRQAKELLGYLGITDNLLKLRMGELSDDLLRVLAVRKYLETNSGKVTREEFRRKLSEDGSKAARVGMFWWG